MAERPALAIVDDHSLIRGGFTAQLVAAGFAEPLAVRRTEDLPPDNLPATVLCDLLLPCGRQGREAVEYLVAGGCRVLAISSLAGAGAQLEALAAGARGFVHKGEAEDRFVAAALRVAAGGYWIGPALAGHLLHDIDALPLRRGEVGPRARALLRCLAQGDTQEEFERSRGLAPRSSDGLLAQVLAAEGRRRGSTVPSVREREVIDLVGGAGLALHQAARELDMAEGTLRTHLERIRQKYLRAHPEASQHLRPGAVAALWAEELAGRAG
ncbi:hypothetical protein ACWDRR_41395 [Kitasatospora sp. NPDC003701]